jgi:hypothetical protein
MTTDSLKKSMKVVGQLRPVIRDAKGRIVDGLHRKASNPNWIEETREDIATEEDYWVARAHLNYARRNAKLNTHEKKLIINNLAEHYVAQGLTVGDPPINENGRLKPQKNEVTAAIIKALSGAINRDTIYRLLDDKYKQERGDSKLRELNPNPEESIYGRYGTRRRRVAERVIEKLKEQTLQEALDDPDFRQQAMQRELMEQGIDPQPIFARDAPIFVDKAPSTDKAETRKRRRTKDELQAGRLFKNWSAHNIAVSVAGSMYCPVCGKDSFHLEWECCGMGLVEARNELKGDLENGKDIKAVQT